KSRSPSWPRAEESATPPALTRAPPRIAAKSRLTFYTRGTGCETLSLATICCSASFLRKQMARQAAPSTRRRKIGDDRDGHDAGKGDGRSASTGRNDRGAVDRYPLCGPRHQPVRFQPAGRSAAAGL